MSTVWMLHVYVQKFKVPLSETDKVYSIHGRNGHNNESGMYLSMVTFSCTLVRVHGTVFFLTGWNFCSDNEAIDASFKANFFSEREKQLSHGCIHTSGSGISLPSVSKVSLDVVVSFHFKFAFLFQDPNVISSPTDLSKRDNCLHDAFSFRRDNCNTHEKIANNTTVSQKSHQWFWFWYPLRRTHNSCSLGHWQR